jgi:uncharacterized repeat protein (TIGR01451 family)
MALDTLGGVSGTVFIDSGTVANAQVQLYRDSNNNNTFDGSDVLVATDATDSSGRYSFTGLASDNYFAVQPEQTVGSNSLPERVSPRLAVDGNGAAGAVIDRFDTVSADTTDVEPPGTPVDSVQTASDALGEQRDFEAELVQITGGSGSEQATIKAGGGLLQTDPSVFAVGRYMVTWDGMDAAGNFNPTGLGNVDLTEVNNVSGQAQGICFVNVFPDEAGQQLVLRVYTDANRFSQATIANLTEDTFQDVFVPLTGSMNGISFQAAGTSGGADFTNVGAVTLEIIDGDNGSDFSMDNLGVLGTNFATANFQNESPAPLIDVEKLTNGNQADLPTDPDVPIVAPGSTVTWTYLVTNTGTVPITTVTLVDDRIGAITTIINQGNGDNVLDPAEVWTYRATGTAITGFYGNQATVTGLSAAGRQATDSDTSNYRGATASIDIEKFTNGNQADNATDSDVPQLNVGSAVTWTYQVTNNGSLDLNNVQVTDNVLGAITNITDRGDGDTVLEPNEIWRYTATGTAQTGAYENLGSVSAIAENQQTVTDQDFSHYVGISAGIQVKKFVNGFDADTSGSGPNIIQGNLVTFTYVVTNTGNVALSNVVLSDDNGTPGNTADDFSPTFTTGDTDGDTQLDTTETWRYQATRSATLGAYQNVGRVTANAPSGTQLSDDDPSNYLGVPVPPLPTKRRFLASTYRSATA